MKVWLVGYNGYDERSVNHVCLSYESALKRWNEIRDNLIKQFEDMIIFELEEGFGNGDAWKEHIKSLQELKPREWCNCDRPFINEMEAEE